jgi:hypothetical protein
VGCFRVFAVATGMREHGGVLVRAKQSQAAHAASQQNYRAIFCLTSSIYKQVVLIVVLWSFCRELLFHHFSLATFYSFPL